MITIRPAHPEDANSVYSFVCDLEGEQFDRRSFGRLYRSNISDPNNVYLVAYDHEPIGYISCHVQGLLHHGGKIAEIQEMYVIPAFRNRGVGKMLLQKLIDRLKKKKVLQAEVTSSLKRRDAHRFYLQAGFRHTSSKFVIPIIDQGPPS